MRLFLAVLAATLVTNSEGQERKQKEASSGRRVVCYYTNWSVYRPGTAKFSPQNINPYLCTHLIYAFGGLDRENGLRPYDKYQDIEQGGYAKFTGLKTYNKELKTMLAIGGWNEGSARFSPLVADPERRREFVRNVIKFLRQNHFDGLDLDWEYPAYRDGGKPKDKENYAQLVQELREEFERESSKTGRPRLLLTMAVPAGIEYIDKGYDVPKLNKYLDFMNILSYDYHSAFEPSVNHHSPLYSLEEDSEYNFDSKLTIDATVKHYLLKGADADKLVLGIPTYGRSYTLFNPDSTDLGSPADGPGEQGEATREKGYLAYYEICGNMKDGWTVVQPKEDAMGPYAYNGNQWVGYDDEAIVRKKSQYVNEKNLGGIMFWSIDNDDFRGKCHDRAYPLIEAAKEALLGKAASGGNSNRLPSSSAGSRGGKTSSKQLKSKTTSRSTTTTTAAPLLGGTITTPEPPTTPDPGSDFVCKDEGFFPHPRDCKKYFWCLDSGPSDLGIVAHQFTCPSGLYFNKAADSCDFARNVICKKKSSTSGTTTTSTTTAAPKTSKPYTSKITYAPKTTSTTTSTTTEAAPLEFEEAELEGQLDEDYKEEDPQTIKQLIQLIKKLGGVAELEKQLEGNSGVDSTTPAISKSLYQRVISSGSPRYQTLQRNGPTGPQNEGLNRERSSSSFRTKDKPQYVTIKRERPSTTTENTAIVYAVEETVDEGLGEENAVPASPPRRESQPRYQSIQRNRGSQSSGSQDSGSQDSRSSSLGGQRPRYQPSERFRPKLQSTTEEAEAGDVESSSSERSTTLKYTSILRSRSTSTTPEPSAPTTPKYVVLQRGRTPSWSSTQPAEEDVVTTENELTSDDEEVVTDRIVDPTTTTPRPSRLKVSELATTAGSLEPGITTSTQSIPTSTRVVTEVVEGPTMRQRVPLSKLRQFFKIRDLEDNSVVETANVVETKSPTTEEIQQTTLRPILQNFNRRRPNVSITTTARTTPAFLVQRRNRFRSTTPFTTEASLEATSPGSRGRFVPSRTRTKNEDSPSRRFTPRTRPTTESSSEDSNSAESVETTSERSRYKNSYSFRRRTTEKPSTSDNPSSSEESNKTSEIATETPSRRSPSRPQFTTESSSEDTNSASSSEIPSRYRNSLSFRRRTTQKPSTSTEKVKDDSEDELFIPGNSRDSNVIRKPLLKSRFPSRSRGRTTPEPTTNPPPSTSTAENISPPSELISSTTETMLDGEILKPIENINATTSPNDAIFITTSLPPTTYPMPTLNESYTTPYENIQLNSSQDAKNSENETTLEEKENYSTLPYIYPTEINSMTIHSEDPLSFTSTENSDVPKFSSRDNQIKQTDELMKPESTLRLNRRRKLPKSLNGTESSKNIIEEIVDSKEDGRKKIILRRRKPVSRSTTEIPSTTSEPEVTFASRHSKTRMMVIKRKRPTTESYSLSSVEDFQATETPKKIQRGRVRYFSSSTIPDEENSIVDDNLVSSSKDNAKTRNRVRKRPVSSTTESAISSEDEKSKRVIVRGRKKFTESKDTPQSTEINFKRLNNTENISRSNKKSRKVLLRKTSKDLVVEESMSPGSRDEFIRSSEVLDVEPSSDEDLDIDFTEDRNIIHTASEDNEETVQNRGRRPAFRKTVARGSTTTTTPEPPQTTARQRTTVQLLRQRINRFKAERRSTTPPPPLSLTPQELTEEGEEVPPSSRPATRKEYRRLIRPLQPEDSALDASHDISKSSPQNVLRPAKKPFISRGKEQYLEEVTPGQAEEYPTEPLPLPDLANVAVAAIQSLATSTPPAPLPTTFYYEPVERGTRPPPVTRPPPPRPPVVAAPRRRPTTASRGSVAHVQPPRSSPRPFSKLNYDDYEDYYAEPVDVPLSGKVRIHNDGYIECLDIGNFPHPFSCRKFISCAKMENEHLLGWEYTCPKGLSFDPIGGICNWNAGLGCKE